jgi:hypothetical protein
MSVRALPSRPLRVALLAALLVTAVLAQPSGGVAAQPAAGSKPAIFDDGTWYLRDSLSTGVATSTFRYGRPGDIPVMGDWDGDGDDTVGVVRFTGPPGGPFEYTWFLRDSNGGGAATVTPFVFGDVRFVAVDQLGTIPVVGDWDGDGDDTAGVLQYATDVDGPMRWNLRNSNSSGAPDLSFSYSRGRDVPVAGDWDGDGDDTVGVFRGNKSWLLNNSNSGGLADISFAYGSASLLELPVVGDWNGDGTYTPAVLRNNPATDESGGFEVWLFRNSNTGGGADGQITYGSDAFELSPPIEVIPRLSWR